MNSIKELILTTEASILSALEKIEQSKEKIVLIVNEQKQLIATVTDGDIRRGLLQGNNLNSPVSSIMNTKPIMADQDADITTHIEDMKKNIYKHLPIVDHNKKIIKIFCYEELIKEKKLGFTAVVMAGGLGQRLRPYTEFVPKPMLEIDGQPMLLRLIHRLRENNFTHIYLSVNYKKEIIQNYFGDGEKFGVKINYLVENTRLGTAGALSLLPSESLPSHFLVLNADLVTEMNFEALYDFHIEHQDILTLSVRTHHIDVPYGVVNIANGLVQKIVEKPSYDFFINAGIYMLSKDAVSFVPKEEYLDMPELIKRLIEAGHKVRGFTAYENWIDVGCPEDMQRAREYS